MVGRHTKIRLEISKICSGWLIVVGGQYVKPCSLRAAEVQDLTGQQYQTYGPDLPKVLVVISN